MLRRDDAWRMVFTVMGFPSTSPPPPPTEAAAVRTTYSCDAVRCDFSTALGAIERDLDATTLIPGRLKEVCTQIVSIVDAKQNVFLPARLDGYVITRMGREWVRLDRTGASGKGITGEIDYTDLLKLSIMMQKPRW